MDAHEVTRVSDLPADHLDIIYILRLDVSNIEHSWVSGIHNITWQCLALGATVFPPFGYPTTLAIKSGSIGISHRFPIPIESRDLVARHPFQQWRTSVESGFPHCSVMTAVWLNATVGAFGLIDDDDPVIFWEHRKHM